MARIRSIKPEFFTSLTIGRLNPLARLTFIGLWTYADDGGRGIDDVRLVRAALWPLDERSLVDVEGDLDTLHEAGLIRRYEIHGTRYLAITNWAEHQRISHPLKSRLPEPPEPSSTSGFNPLREGSGNFPESSGEIQEASSKLPEASASRARARSLPFPAPIPAPAVKKAFKSPASQKDLRKNPRGRARAPPGPLSVAISGVAEGLGLAGWK